MGSETRGCAADSAVGCVAKDHLAAGTSPTMSMPPRMTLEASLVVCVLAGSLAAMAAIAVRATQHVPRQRTDMGAAEFVNTLDEG